MKAALENSTHPANRAEWRSWFQSNHSRTEGIWLVTYKKSAQKPILEYNDAVEEALCFGWIDSKKRKLDEHRTITWYAPRKPKSGWSRPNKERIERLTLNGQLTKHGLSKIEEAKKDGSWTLLDAMEALDMPQDLVNELQGFEKAEENFSALPPSAKRHILQWILHAKTPATRSKRIRETAELAEKNVRANQWRPKDDDCPPQKRTKR